MCNISTLTKCYQKAYERVKNIFAFVVVFVMHMFEYDCTDKENTECANGALVIAGECKIIQVFSTPSY